MRKNRIIPRKKKKSLESSNIFDDEDQEERENFKSGFVKKTLFLLFKIFRLKEQPFEAMKQELFIYFNFPITAFAQLIGLGIVFSSLFYKEWNLFFIIPPIASFLSCVIVFIALVLSWILKIKRRFISRLSSLFMNCSFIASISFSFQGHIVGSQFIIFWLIPPIYFSALGAGPFELVLWGSVYFVSIFCHFMYRLIQLLLDSSSNIHITQAEMLHFYASQLFSLLIVSFFIYFFHFFLYTQLRSFEKRTKEIMEGVVKLNFSSPSLSSFMSTPNQFCSPSNLMLKRICVSIREYKKYLPQGLVDVQRQQFYDEEEEKERIQKKIRTQTAKKMLKRFLNVDKEEKRKRDKNKKKKTDRLMFLFSPSGRPIDLHSPSEELSDSDSDSDSDSSSSTQYTLTDEDASSVSSSTTGNQRQHSKTNSLIDYSVFSSFGTFMMIEFIFENAFLFEKRDREKEKLFQRFYQEFVDITNKLVVQTKGNVLHLFNQRILCCWNIKSRVTSHEINALHSALRIIEEFKNLQKNTPKDEFSCVGNCFLNISISTETCFCGFMGGSSIKGFQTFGNVHEKYTALNVFSKNAFDEIPKEEEEEGEEEEEKEGMKFVKGVKGRHVILVDEVTKNRIQFDFLSIFVNEIKVNNERKSFSVYEVIGNFFKKNEKDEWIYELFDQEKKDNPANKEVESEPCLISLNENPMTKIKLMEDIKKSIYEGKFEEAKDLFKKFSEINGFMLCPIFFQLKKMIWNRKKFNHFRV